MKTIRSVAGSIKRMSFHGSRKELSDNILDKSNDYIKYNTSHHPASSLILLDIVDDIKRAYEKAEDKYDFVLIDFIHFVSLKFTCNKIVEVVNSFKIFDIVFMKNGTRKILKLLEDHTSFPQDMIKGATKLARKNNSYERTIVFDMLSHWLSSFAERQLEFPNIYSALFELRMKFPNLFRVTRYEGPPLFMDEKAIQSRQRQKEEDNEEQKSNMNTTLSSADTTTSSKKSDIVDDLLDLSFDDNYNDTIQTTDTSTFTAAMTFFSSQSRGKELEEFSSFVEANNDNDAPPLYPPPQIPSSSSSSTMPVTTLQSTTSITPPYNPFDYFK